MRQTDWLGLKWKNENFAREQQKSKESNKNKQTSKMRNNDNDTKRSVTSNGEKKKESRKKKKKKKAASKPSRAPGVGTEREGEVLEELLPFFSASTHTDNHT